MQFKYANLAAEDPLFAWRKVDSETPVGGDTDAEMIHHWAPRHWSSDRIE
jgi:hypothetical protein